jgi:hypothetical protein
VRVAYLTDQVGTYTRRFRRRQVFDAPPASFDACPTATVLSTYIGGGDRVAEQFKLVCHAVTIAVTTKRCKRRGNHRDESGPADRRGTRRRTGRVRWSTHTARTSPSQPFVEQQHRHQGGQYPHHGQTIRPPHESSSCRRRSSRRYSIDVRVMRITPSPPTTIPMTNAAATATSDQVTRHRPNGRGG